MKKLRIFLRVLEIGLQNTYDQSNWKESPDILNGAEEIFSSANVLEAYKFS